jgi:hypothetical protein
MGQLHETLLGFIYFEPISCRYDVLIFRKKSAVHFIVILLEETKQK